MILLVGAYQRRYTGAMRKLVTSALLLLAVCVTVFADSEKPRLPKVPQGFDEGRTLLEQEVREDLVDPKILLSRLFERADIDELSVFVHAHLLSDERQLLDDALKLEGELSKQRELAGVRDVFTDGKIEPAKITSAISGMLKTRKYDLGETVAWLYARGFNFRILQRALNGERLDAFRMRAELRAYDDPSAETVLAKGLWEFNLDDGREEKGGHYNGPQLVQFLLKMNWKADDFEALLKSEIGKELTAVERKLIAWGDPELIWTVIEPWTPESMLIKAVAKRYAKQPSEELLQACIDRAGTTLRWFRTGGLGVRGVYRGPWPSAKGDPVPPTKNVIQIGNVDTTQFANALDTEIQGHFENMGDTITLVVYDDGSARAIIDKPNRTPIQYPANHPFGSTTSTRQPYEGRVSVEGRNALLYLVFEDRDKAAPEQFELANVKLAANECFLVADIDDGLNLTPILLRRINPLVD